MYEKYQLPFCYNELEPYIDALTMEIHYTKHLQSYLDNINKISKEYPEFFKGKTIEMVLSKLDKIPKKIRQDVINQGGGVVNHNLYFSILSPDPKISPDGKLLLEINRTFGSIEHLMGEVSRAAIKQFGSGWGWLVKDKKGKLQVMSTANQDSPLSLGLTPILGIDVWEHAYYLKYKNLRATYVEKIWNVIDWGKVEELYEN